MYKRIKYFNLRKIIYVHVLIPFVIYVTRYTSYMSSWIIQQFLYCIIDALELLLLFFITIDLSFLPVSVCATRKTTDSIHIKYIIPYVCVCVYICCILRYRICTLYVYYYIFCIIYTSRIIILYYYYYHLNSSTVAVLTCGTRFWRRYLYIYRYINIYVVHCKQNKSTPLLYHSAAYLIPYLAHFLHYAYILNNNFIILTYYY